MNFYSEYKAQIWSVIIYLILCFIIFYACSKLLPQDLYNIVNIITILSAYTSIFALVIMLYQVMTVKKVAKETKQRINSSLIIANYSELVGLTKAVQGDVRNGKYELALYKLQQLRESMLNNKHRVNDVKIDYSNHLSIVGSHINALHNCVLNDEKLKINKLSIIKDLENLIEFLVDKSSEHINK